MKVIGLTGGIASGKSTVSKWFEEDGYIVIDADSLYKNLSKSGNILYNTIIQTFGDQYLLEQGEIDWSKLSQLVFHHPKELMRLNHVTHPIVKDVILEQLSKYKAEGIPLVIVSVPLLYEAKFDAFCDQVICVYCDEKTQINRLMMRNQISYEEASKRVSSQMSIELKKEQADFNIDNSGNLDSTYHSYKEVSHLLGGN